MTAAKVECLTENHWSVHSNDPLNKEPCLAVLTKAQYTPEAVAFHRNHGPTPSRPTTLRLRCSSQARAVLASHAPEADVQLDQTLSISEVIEWGKQGSAIDLEAAVVCAGNRRSIMDARCKPREVHGVNWGKGAISNSLYSGVLLNEFLRHHWGLDLATLPPSCGLHIHFLSSQDCHESPFFGASIPLELAQQRPVTLAWAMNGVIGARNVKWVDGISLSHEEIDCFYQTKDYKIFAPHVTMATKAAHLPVTPAMISFSTTSVISVPQSGAVLPAAGSIQVEGYALGHAGVPISKVFVLLVPACSSFSHEAVTNKAAAVPFDHWIEVTTLQPRPRDSRHWGWTRFAADLPLPEAGGTEWALVSCCEDMHGNKQEREAVYNLRGLDEHGWDIARFTLARRFESKGEE